MQRLQSLHVDAVVLNAVDGREYRDVREVIGQSAQLQMLRRYGREISLNEVCAVLSHLDALRAVAREEASNFCLIVEDDADPLPRAQIPTAIDTVDADIVIGGYTKVGKDDLRWFDLRNPFVRIQLLGDSAIVERYHNRTPGAVAYFVRPSAAAAMLRLVDSDGFPTWVADDWGFYQTHGLRIRHCHPPLFLEDDDGVSYLAAGRLSAGLTDKENSIEIRPLRFILANVRIALIRWRLLRDTLRRRGSGRLH